MNGNSGGSAYGPQNVQAFGNASSDLFGGFGDIEKMKADELESGEYQQAAAYAGQEAQFSQQSTAIQEAQKARETTMAMGRTAAEVAGAGFAASGSGLDIMRSNAQQGALAQAVTSEQGQITTQGYQEQQQSFETMATIAGNAAKQANLASIGSFIAAGINVAAAAVPS
ncbi:MAG TPA: hypothetical protein VL048_03715 [Xanthobacteraceae bacterium]|nr:hypothetical protein [Xanthobacteraceae bacterium]